MMAPGTTSMLRARRRDENLKPNRRLDRKSSRGMLYENEELRLRTININAEVERGQNDIKKLRRENEQLRREIWGLREQYDRLEGLLGKAKRRGSKGDDSDSEEGCEEEDLEYDDEDDDDEADLDNAENQQKVTTCSRGRRNSVRVLFDGLSVVDEETDEEATCDSANNKHKHEQQFFGKIKLPSGREGVFMSDGVLPSSNGVQACGWPEQSYYNYTFTPVDSALKIHTVQDNDGYFGTAPTGEFFQRRGGPDLFISGAYPVAMSPTTFPSGGNLDQLLKQMNGKESEIVPAVQITDVQAQSEELEEAEIQKNRNNKEHENESQIVHGFTLCQQDEQNRSPAPLTSLFSARRKAACVKSSKNFSAQAVVKQQALISEAQKRVSYLYTPETDCDTFKCCNNGLNSLTKNSIRERLILSKCDKDTGSQVQQSNKIIEKCSEENGDGGCECDISVVNRRKSTVSPERRRSVETTKVHRQEIVRDGEEKATRDKPSRSRDVRPRTLVFETRNRNFTVQEVIDALEAQLDSNLEDAVKGVRAANGNYFVCLNNEENVDALLENGLNIQGEKIALEDTSRGIILITATGVPYDVSDEKLSKALAQHGSVIGDIERRLYKGVDTGERVIKLKALDKDIPTSITVEGSKIALQVSKPTEEESGGETCAKPEIPSQPLGNCFTTDRFCSQISVRLKQPNPKSNRSLDNLLDTNTSKQLHNTSLPIINALDDASPVEPERNAVTQDKTIQPSTAENTSLQSPPTNVNKDLPNVFSETPNQKATCQTVQLHNTTDDSVDSADVILPQTVQFQSNPFVGGFQMSAPVSPAPVNPFTSSPNYTQHSLHQCVAPTDHQRHLFLPQTTNNPKVCSPYPKLTMPTLPYNASLSNSGLPSPALTPQNSPQINRIPNFPFDSSNYYQTSAIRGNNSNPGIFLPTPYFHGDMLPQSHISASNPALNVLPPQPSSCSTQIPVNHSSQNVIVEGNKQHEPKEKTPDMKKPQSTSMPSSPVSVRRHKPSISGHQHSKSSGDEGARASPASARRKLSRKQSSTNSTRSHHNVETSGGPNATSSPNTKHKSSVDHSRKTSGAITSNADPAGGGQMNVVDVSRSSSSGQDSPTKPDRRRRVSIYFNNKKGAKRRDSVFVPNGAGAPGAGILTRSLSLDTTHRYTAGSTTDVVTGHSAGAETTTCSERERTNSASSRTSSATGASRLRKHSECSNRGSSINDGGKVPWCGCWGNGCL